MPRQTSLRSAPFARIARALGLAIVVWTCAACVSKPTMTLHHAEITGVRIGFPPSLGVLMTVVINVYNPNSYDVAVRAVRGQLVLANRYTLPVDFRADGGGVWLPSDAITPVRVPIVVPVQLGLTLVRESLYSPMIPYRFAGRADVTATRTFQLEKDDYSFSVWGSISRQQMEAALALSL